MRLTTFGEAVVDSLRGSTRSARLTAPVVVASAAVYGAVAGSFGWASFQPSPQPLASAIKVPALVVGSAALSLPSYIVISILLGLRNDLPAALGRLGQGLSVFTIVLAALAPFTLLFYVSVSSYNLAVLLNGLPFLVATLAARVALVRGLDDLIAANPKHRLSIGGFLLVFVFVAVQMAWSLRPFVGNPLEPFQWFREQAFTNAYEAIADKIWQVLSS